MSLFSGLTLNCAFHAEIFSPERPSLVYVGVPCGPTPIAGNRSAGMHYVTDGMPSNVRNICPPRRKR
jgi:hypothetical protein